MTEEKATQGFCTGRPRQREGSESGRAQGRRDVSTHAAAGDGYLFPARRPIRNTQHANRLKLLPLVA